MTVYCANGTLWQGEHLNGTILPSVAGDISSAGLVGPCWVAPSILSPITGAAGYEFQLTIFYR